MFRTVATHFRDFFTPSEPALGMATRERRVWNARISVRRGFCWHGLRAAEAACAVGYAVEGEIDHGCRIERQQLGNQEAAHDGHAERTSELRARACAEREGQGAQEGRHRR